MSITPPEDYVYGTVVGRFLDDVLDSADLDRYPDVTAAIGSLTFTPKVSYYKNLNMPATFISKAVPAVIDAAGFVRDTQGNLGVVLIDSTSPGISPSGWPYTVSMTISGKTLPSFDIHVVGGTTIDLTTVMPAATSASTVIIVSEAARVAAEAARDEVVAIRDDLIENPPGGGGGVPSGGTTDQAFLKNSNTSGDAGWRTLTKALVGLANVNNTADVDKPVSTATTTQLNLKAPLSSPAFTDNPTAPTPSAGDNDTSIATTAFVTAALAAAKSVFVYNATTDTWPGAPVSTLPVLWVSTNDAAAVQPPAMREFDVWVQHPDAVV